MEIKGDFLETSPPNSPPTNPTHTSILPEAHSDQFSPGNVSVPEAFAYPSNYSNRISLRKGRVNDVPFRHVGEVFGEGEDLAFSSYHPT